MTGARLILLLAVVFVLLVAAAGAGAYWYLFGANEVDAAELVPANTLFFATIPNAATVVEGYETSQLKTLVDSPNSQPAHDAIVNLVGQKNIDVINAFLPNLSGQSFIAVTHFDYDHPEQVGLIAAMKPKAGMGDFGTFLEKLKATWPDILKQGKTGTGTVEGVDYEWIQGPGAPDKICVAQFKGWIVTSWGEAALQDWLQRYRKKSTTSSLAQDLNYQKSLARVGDNPMTLVYVNDHDLVALLQKQLAVSNPVAGNYLAKKFDALGGAAMATRFENGEIVDRFSFLMPRPAQLDSGMSADPCPFDTLKFTGPDTRFYWASSINWKQYYKNLKEQSQQSAAPNPMADKLLTFLQNWSRGANLDGKHNVADALGSEFSVQAEWSPDSTYPEIGLFLKLDKPDDFKPTITAIIDSVRQAFATTAVIKEIDVPSQKFATLQFVQSSPFSPTITEDGPYLGVFMTENQAVRSFQRNDAATLVHRADFIRQVGDKRNGAEQVLFFDSPYLLNRAYLTALPYLSLAGMFNKDLAALLKGKNLPPDLTWLAPMGTWSCVVTTDEEGIQGYSVSGIGNQGIFLGGAAGASAALLQTMGLLPKAVTPHASTYAPVASPLATTSGTPSANPTASAVTVYLTSDSRILFNNLPVPSDQFPDFLKSQKAANPDLKLTLLVNKNCSPDILSTVMDAGASAGFGVLPYTYTSAPDPSLPPAPTTNSDVPSPPSNAPTNAAPAPVPEPTPITNSIPNATSPIPEPAPTH